MSVWSLVQRWWARQLHRDKRGQGTAEYVLLILAVVLFLIIAAFALQAILNGPIFKMGTWIGHQNAP
jgi:hypothetical protein